MSLSEMASSSPLEMRGISHESSKEEPKNGIVLSGNLVAVSSETNAAILDYLTWYSVRSGLYEMNALRSLVLQAGLEESCLPPKIRVPDAFRRATRGLEQGREVGSGVYYKYMVRKVVNNPKAIQRNLAKEVVDRKNRKTLIALAKQS
jgi:hypothetical protein